MSVDSSAERSTPRIRRAAIGAVAIIVTVAAIGVVIVAQSHLSARASCSATLAGSHLSVTFTGPHSSDNCSQWTTRFGQDESWSVRHGLHGDSPTICRVGREDDVATVRDGDTSVLGSLACLWFLTDGWNEVDGIGRIQ